MIFYFSGTGNSRHAAEKIALSCREKLYFIPHELDRGDGALDYSLGENELLGFVFPVYAWGPPKILLDFIGRLKLTGERPYVFSLCTCGEEEGRTTKIIGKALGRKGLTLDSAFAVKMPNNYIVGFDVEPEEVREEKLEKADERIAGISAVLESRTKGVFQPLPGACPALKSSVIYPLFNRFAIDHTKWFSVTDDCNLCGICQEVCPVHTIELRDKPVWGKKCAQCFACIHRCPVRAIQYGKGTVNKGRYLHPGLPAIFPAKQDGAADL